MHKNAQKPPRTVIKHIIAPYNRSSGPTSRRYRMGFVFGITGATIYIHRGLPITEVASRGLGRVVILQRSCGENQPTLLHASACPVNVRKVGGHLENQTTSGLPS